MLKWTSFTIDYMHTVTRESREPERYVDPAMIGILAGMALMFIIICVVLRLFSRLVYILHVLLFHLNETIGLFVFNKRKQRVLKINLNIDMPIFFFYDSFPFVLFIFPQQCSMAWQSNYFQYAQSASNERISSSR